MSVSEVGECVGLVEGEPPIPTLCVSESLSVSEYVCARVCVS